VDKQRVVFHSWQVVIIRIVRSRSWQSS
jgi:hypothetical protein